MKGDIILAAGAEAAPTVSTEQHTTGEDGALKIFAKIYFSGTNSMNSSNRFAVELEDRVLGLRGSDPNIGSFGLMQLNSLNINFKYGWDIN